MFHWTGLQPAMTANHKKDNQNFKWTLVSVLNACKQQNLLRHFVLHRLLGKCQISTENLLPNTDIRYMALLLVINCISFTTGLKYEMLTWEGAAFHNICKTNIVQSNLTNRTFIGKNLNLFKHAYYGFPLNSFKSPSKYVAL